MPPLVYKTFGTDGVSIRPYKTHKTQNYVYTSGSNSNPAEITFGEGIAFATASGLITGSYGTVETQTRTLVDGFVSASSSANIDGTFKEPLFESVQNLFYSSNPLSSGSITFPLGGDGDRGWTPSGSIYVFNIAQQAYGETIRPGTFQLTISGSIFTDTNGAGRIYSGSSLVGNIFYPHGLCVLDKTSNLIQITSGTSLDIQFDATQTIYEYQVMATINPGEFNYSFNPSALRFTTEGAKVLDEMSTGSLSPYITSIGLYNNSYELIAVAKVPRPIKRLNKSQQTFVIRFDF